MPQLTMNTCYL